MEIKFKVLSQNQATKKWEFVGYERILDDLWFASADGSHWVDGTFRGKKLIRRIFTGLKDKMGANIYWGDLLKTPIGSVVKVVFGGGSFGYIDTLNEAIYGIFSTPEGLKAEETVVVGDIFEHTAAGELHG